MKALSIKDPWAWLIASGIKDVENRTWKTNYRGRILIHVPAKRDSIVIIPADIASIPKPDERTTKAIIGEVTITDCIKNSQSPWAETDCWHWVLTDPLLYKSPIKNVKGKLGLWNYKKEK